MTDRYCIGSRFVVEFPKLIDLIIIMVNAHLEGMAQVGSSIFKAFVLKRGNGMYIKSSRATAAQVREKNVTWLGR